MAFGYGAPTANAAHLATATIVGGAAGAAQAVALNAMDAAGTLGAPVVPQVGTNGQLVDFIAGGTALALGLAGAFGKGPLKRNTSVSAAVATYGATAITGGLAFRFAGGSVGASPAAVAAVCRAKAMLATRMGAPGTPSTPLGGWNPRNVTNAGVVIPQSATQRVGSLIG